MLTAAAIKSLLETLNKIKWLDYLTDMDSRCTDEKNTVTLTRRIGFFIGLRISSGYSFKMQIHNVLPANAVSHRYFFFNHNTYPVLFFRIF